MQKLKKIHGAVFKPQPARASLRIVEIFTKKTWNVPLSKMTEIFAKKTRNVPLSIMTKILVKKQGTILSSRWLKSLLIKARNGPLSRMTEIFTKKIRNGYCLLKTYDEHIPPLPCMPKYDDSSSFK